MKYFRLEHRSDQISIYPLVCWHIGARQSSIKFIESMIDRVNDDPEAVAIYMGDGGECVTKTSKGNIYEQLMSPGAQLKECARLLKKIEPKKLKFGIRGNHGNRIDKDSGLGWDDMLCSMVGIPYLGVSAIGDVFLNGRAFSLYTHHGSAGAVTASGKMAAGHKAEQIVLADIALTAHTHAYGECWPKKIVGYTDSRAQRVRHLEMRSFVCGSAYDSRDGYAEEKQYPILTPGHIAVDVAATQDGLEIGHRIFEGSDDKYVNDHQLEKWGVSEEPQIIL